MSANPFQYTPDQRWQGVPALREQLGRTKKRESSMPSVEEQIALAKEHAALLNGNKAILEAIDNVRKRLPGLLGADRPRRQQRAGPHDGQVGIAVLATRREEENDRSRRH